MLRISQTDSEGGNVTLRVEGRLLGPWVQELRRSCQNAEAQGSAVTLDLRDVSFVDAEGIALLEAQIAARVCVKNCSPFIAERLKRNARVPGSETETNRTPLAHESARPDESDLVVRLKRGEDEAFEVLVKTYGARLLSVARRLLRDEDAARDALQDGFLAAFRSFRSFKAESRLSTWLHRIVVNAALMKLRSRRRKPEESLEPLLPTFAEDGHHAQPIEPWRASPDPELQAERSELRTLLRDRIDRLPESYRAVLVLRDLEELDTAEVAELLSITEAAVKIRLHRARQALRALLAPHLSVRLAK